MAQSRHRARHEILSIALPDQLDGLLSYKRVPMPLATKVNAP